MEKGSVYTAVLDDDESILALQYLEAQRFDRRKGGNLTKVILNSHIVFALRETEPPKRLMQRQEILDAVAGRFTESHRVRLEQLIPPRIDWLAKKGVAKHHTKEDAYALAFEYRKKLKALVEQGEESDVALRAGLYSAIDAMATEKQIDYAYDRDTMATLAHECIVWLLANQARRFSASHQDFLVLDAESVVEGFLSSRDIKVTNHGIDKNIVLDLLPGAIFHVLNDDENGDLKRYLRAKADAFVWQAFMQNTPDVQAVCKKLLQGDTIFLDTSVLVRCIAERHLPANRRPLLTTLAHARTLNFKLQTFQCYIDELISHIKGPVLLEWRNHYKQHIKGSIAAEAPEATTLIRVFDSSPDKSVEDCVMEVTGNYNESVNTQEFLQHEFGVTCAELFRPQNDEEQGISDLVESAWFQLRVRRHTMSREIYELLVRNDVKAFCSIVFMRSKLKAQGANYGDKIWLLTADRVPWRIPRKIDETRNPQFGVAMSLSYLVNCVSTLAIASSNDISDEVLPAAMVLEQGDMIPMELRDTIRKLRQETSGPRYQIDRRIRDLVHELKSRKPDLTAQSMEDIEI